MSFTRGEASAAIDAVAGPLKTAWLAEKARADALEDQLRGVSIALSGVVALPGFRSNDFGSLVLSERSRISALETEIASKNRLLPSLLAEGKALEQRAEVAEARVAELERRVKTMKPRTD